MCEALITIGIKNAACHARKSRLRATAFLREKKSQTAACVFISRGELFFPLSLLTQLFRGSNSPAIVIRFIHSFIHVTTSRRKKTFGEEDIDCESSTVLCRYSLSGRVRERNVLLNLSVIQRERRKRSFQLGESPSERWSE